MGRSSKSSVDEDFDDFDDNFIEDLDFDVNLFDLDDANGAGKRRYKSRKKNKGAARKKLNHGPDIWDDDWIDPADDLMYGFDDSDHRWHAQ